MSVLRHYVPKQDMVLNYLYTVMEFENVTLPSTYVDTTGISNYIFYHGGLQNPDLNFICVTWS